MTFRYLFTCSLLLAFCVGNAQFGGLNKIKDKAKNAGSESKSGKEEKAKEEPKTDQKSVETSNKTTTASEPEKQESKKRPLYKVNDFSSDVHRKNVNKIVFSTKPEGIAFGKENEALFVKNYTLGDPLFFRAYTENSLGNYAILNDKNSFHLRWKFNLYLNGQKLGVFKSVKYTESEAEEKWTTFKAVLVNDNLNEYGESAGEFATIIAKNYSKFTAGKHVLKFELFPVSETSDNPDMPVVATEELTIEVPAKLSNTSLCFLRKPAKSDPALEAEILKIAQKTAEEGVKVAKVLIMEKNWTEIRSETTGIIFRKEIKAVLFGTKENGKTCFYQDLIYSKRMFPQKGEDPTYIHEFINVVPLPCSCKL